MLLAAGAIEVGSIAMMWQVRFVALAVTRHSMFVPSLSEFFVEMSVVLSILMYGDALRPLHFVIYSSDFKGIVIYVPLRYF
jgi:hypothetical protein